jgi:hypothetical protein
MSNPIHESIMVGGLAGLASIATLAQSALDAGASPWGLILQAGNAGIVLLLLLKFIPDLMRNQREASTAHQESMQKIVDSHKATVDSLVKSFERHDDAWRDMLSQRGWCPAREINNPAHIHHHHIDE